MNKSGLDGLPWGRRAWRQLCLSSPSLEPGCSQVRVPAQNKRPAPFTRSIQVPSDCYFLHVRIERTWRTLFLSPLPEAPQG